MQGEENQEVPVVQVGEGLEEIEWFVGFREDCSMVYLMDCPECDVLITYPGQGHHCGGVIDENNFREWEAHYYAAVIQELVEIYSVKDLEDVD